MKKFRASTHYNDFTGSSAVDNADLKNVDHFLKNKELIKDNESLFGISVNMGVADMRDGVATVTFLVADLRGSKDESIFLQNNKDDVVLREIQQEMKLTDFFGLFKQFSLTLSFVDGMEGVNYTPLSE